MLITALLRGVYIMKNKTHERKERKTIKRSHEYKKAMSEAFKMVAREMDKLR